ncbi:MAG TPA: ChbG/HpnK family deacetylase [Candidatus Absconditabacterales bacterium]|nr:ChbG/HpnK family deacetylase [Candidatus Absconditabacterales bacterium]
MKKIIITADDFGMSTFFNRGILDLCRERVVVCFSYGTT